MVVETIFDAVMSDGLMDEWFWLCLLGLFAMTFIGSGVIPLPVTLVVFALGSVGETQYVYSAWVVVAIATLGTMAGWWFIGHKLRKHLSEQSFQLAQRSTPGWLRKLSLRFPFSTVFLMNALPMPWDPVRLVLLAHGTSPQSLILPVGLGRFVRYGLVVWLGQAIDQMSTLVVIITALIVVSICVKVVRLMWERQQALSDPAQNEDDVILDTSVEMVS